MKQQAGFTLIELVVVIVILGILAATALPKFIDLGADASQAAVQGIAGAVNSGSAINVGAKKAGNAGAVTVNAADVCTTVILGGLLEGGMPTGYTAAEASTGSGDCSGTAALATCTITEPKNSKTANATVYCAR